MPVKTQSTGTVHKMNSSLNLSVYVHPLSTEVISPALDNGLKGLPIVFTDL